MHMMQAQSDSCFFKYQPFCLITGVLFRLVWFEIDGTGVEMFYSAYQRRPFFYLILFLPVIAFMQLPFICRFLLWTEDCTISHFLLRMSQLLRNITFGKINMEWVGLPQSADAALWPFFPAGRQSLPFGREDVNVMQREHYDALRGTFCVWGHLDCIIHDAVSLPEMLNDTEAMLKHKEKQLSASKPTLRRMISELRSIADIFFANRDLFLADWRQELQVAMCKSLEEVKETLEKVAQDTQRPGPETSSISSGLPHIPDLLRRCVLNARLKGYPQHHVEQASCLMTLQISLREKERERERERERAREGQRENKT